jgi:hypothetical protein
VINLNPKQSGISPTGWIILGAAVILLFLVFTPFMTGEDLTPQSDRDQVLGELNQDDLTPTPESSNPIAAIIENPASYQNQLVSLTGEVADIVSDNALRLENPQIGGRDLLVLSSQSLSDLTGREIDPDALTNDLDRVQLTGVVRTFDRQQLSSDLGLNLDEDTYSGYDGQAVIIAQSLIGLDN